MPPWFRFLTGNFGSNRFVSRTQYTYLYILLAGLIKVDSWRCVVIVDSVGTERSINHDGDHDVVVVMVDASVVVSHQIRNLTMMMDVHNVMSRWLIIDDDAR